MNSRERVLAALNFLPVDRVPKDLGGMASTGISAFAYSNLVESLGLKPRKPKIHDTQQMLALPDMDVLDALGCDVVSIFGDVTNAFDEQEKWEDYDFNGRLDARVRDASMFSVIDDGTIMQKNSRFEFKMPPGSTVFDKEHGGHELVLESELPRYEIKEVEELVKSSVPDEEQIGQIRDLCKQVRESTDKAIFFNGCIDTNIGIAYYGGLAVFPMLCLLEPDYVAELHEMITSYSLEKVRRVLPEIKDNIDIIMLAADDWGTQNALVAPPAVYEKLFKPYLKRVNDEIHRIAPEMKTFMHSCGNIVEALPIIIDSGFDVLNPVQWSTTGDGSCGKWKEFTYGKVALWGGGVNSQTTLPLGSVEDVREEVTRTVDCLAQGSGYIFNNTHNILAEIPGEKVVTMYDAARACGRKGCFNDA